MSAPILTHKPGNSERLIAFADAYQDEKLWMQEFVADDYGRYLFMDCTPINSEHDGARYIYRVFHKPAEALAAWNFITGQSVSLLDLAQALA